MLRHSTAHVMAQAVLELFPGAKFAIGPAIEDGFYYDFDLPGGAHVHRGRPGRHRGADARDHAADQPFVRAELSADDALALFADQPYKCEIIERAADAQADAADAGEVAVGGTVSVYRNTPEFVDLCRGPHVPTTGRLGHFKLMRVAGAYWRGDEKRPMLQRIYGTAWESDAALDGAPPPARGGREARPPQARRRARPALASRRSSAAASPCGTRRARSCAG